MRVASLITKIISSAVTNDPIGWSVGMCHNFLTGREKLHFQTPIRELVEGNHEMGLNGIMNKEHT